MSPEIIVATVLAVVIVGTALLWLDWGWRKNRPKPLEPRPPFGGLPYEETDAERFYGRENNVGELEQMVRYGDFRFGVLTGESGCDKPR